MTDITLGIFAVLALIAMVLIIATAKLEDDDED